MDSVPESDRPPARRRPTTRPRTRHSTQRQITQRQIAQRQIAGNDAPTPIGSERPTENPDDYHCDDDLVPIDLSESARALANRRQEPWFDENGNRTDYHPLTCQLCFDSEVQVKPWTCPNALCEACATRFLKETGAGTRNDSTFLHRVSKCWQCRCPCTYRYMKHMDKAGEIIYAPGQSEGQERELIGYLWRNELGGNSRLLRKKYPIFEKELWMALCYRYEQKNLKDGIGCLPLTEYHNRYAGRVGDYIDKDIQFLHRGFPKRKCGNCGYNHDPWTLSNLTACEDTGCSCVLCFECVANHVTEMDGHGTCPKCHKSGKYQSLHLRNNLNGELRKYWSKKLATRSEPFGDQTGIINWLGLVKQNSLS